MYYSAGKQKERRQNERVEALEHLGPSLQATHSLKP